MKVVLGNHIRKKEFRRGKIPPDVLRIIVASYAEGIFVAIKGESLPKGSRLIKIYVTTVQGARRLVFLVDVATHTGFFLFFRGKNDLLGRNISMQNPVFKRELLRYLHLLKLDIAEGSYATYEAVA